MNRILRFRRKRRIKDWRSLRQYRRRKKRTAVKLRIFLCAALCAEIAAIGDVRPLEITEKEEASMLPEQWSSEEKSAPSLGNGSLFGFTISWREGRLIIYKIDISSRKDDRENGK